MHRVRDPRRFVCNDDRALYGINLNCGRVVYGLIFRCSFGRWRVLADADGTESIAFIARQVVNGRYCAGALDP